MNHEQAKKALHDFLLHRFELFGDYEDAIHKDESILFHSVLTPMLNIGLLSPREVIQAALEYEDRVPLNSLEGFVRQVIAGENTFEACTGFGDVGSERPTSGDMIDRFPDRFMTRQLASNRLTV